MASNDPRPLLSVSDDSASGHDFATLGGICLAIAERRSIEARARLETVEVSAETLGAAETYRLRALTYHASGEFAQAYDADRQAFHEAVAFDDKLRDLFVEGVAARVDHDDLRRRADWFADEAYTDALTGLPNRRSLEQYVDELVGRGESADSGCVTSTGSRRSTPSTGICPVTWYCAGWPGCSTGSCARATSWPGTAATSSSSSSPPRRRRRPRRSPAASSTPWRPRTGSHWCRVPRSA